MQARTDSSCTPARVDFRAALCMSASDVRSGRTSCAASSERAHQLQTHAAAARQEHLESEELHPDGDKRIACTTPDRRLILPFRSMPHPAVSDALLPAIACERRFDAAGQHARGAVVRWRWPVGLRVDGIRRRRHRRRTTQASQSG